MEALRKIVSGSELAPLFSLPYASREAMYEVIVLPMPVDLAYPHGDADYASITEFLRGTLDDFEFNGTRELTSERGTSLEIFD